MTTTTDDKKALATRGGNTLAERYGMQQEQLDLVRRTAIGVQGDDDVLELYLARCKNLGFDPLSKLLYVVPRKRNFKDANNQWRSETVWNFQTSIDGFRSTADAIPGYQGQTAPVWCGPDGKWVDVWLSTTPPAAARVGVYREGFIEPCYANALWSEYAVDTPFWKKMPALMLAKCAEALALRKAFPQRLAGLYVSEEMDQADKTPAKAVAAAAQQVQPALPAAQQDAAPAAEAPASKPSRRTKPEPAEPPADHIDAQFTETPPPTPDEVAANEAPEPTPAAAQRDYSNVKTPAQLTKLLKTLGFSGSLREYVTARAIPFQVTPKGEITPDCSLDIEAQIHFDIEQLKDANRNGTAPAHGEQGDPTLLQAMEQSVDAKTAPDERPISETTRSRIMILCRERKIGDEERHALTSVYSGGKKSTKDLSEAEGRFICQKLELLPLPEEKK